VTTGRYGSEQLEEADIVIADLGELAHALETLS
jgi:hypothetical protein